MRFHLNFHPGSAIEESVEKCLDVISESLIEVQDLFSPGVKLDLVPVAPSPTLCLYSLGFSPHLLPVPGLYQLATQGLRERTVHRVLGNAFSLNLIKMISEYEKGLEGMREELRSLMEAAFSIASNPY